MTVEPFAGDARADQPTSLALGPDRAGFDALARRVHQLGDLGIAVVGLNAALGGHAATWPALKEGALMRGWP